MAKTILTRYCYSMPMMRYFGAVQLAGLTDMIGGLILLFASLLLEPGAWASMSFHWGWPAFLAWLYLLIPGALISTTMYFLLVRDWGASRPGGYATPERQRASMARSTTSAVWSLASSSA